MEEGLCAWSRSFVGLVIGCVISIWLTASANGQISYCPGSPALECYLPDDASLDNSCNLDGACCQNDPNTVPRTFCTNLLQVAGTDGWKLPFTGFDESGSKVESSKWDHFCNKKSVQTVYRMSPSVTKLKTHGYGSYDQYTNRLQFNVDWIAQEGLSFCIIGSHYRKSPFALWEPLKPFIPLAVKNFDIGNHIDPEDSTKMNAFKLPNPDKLREFKVTDPNGRNTSNPWRKSGNPVPVPTHYFENVWLGLQAVRSTSDNNEQVGISQSEIKLDPGFKKRPAHPEWQPDPRCSNPYRVTVTLIEADGLVLHNYLHIKVHAEPVTQPSERNCPTGKIKLLMLEVRDQDGFPVGQFTDDVTCEKDDKTTGQELQCPNQGSTTCKAHLGTKMNHVPCMLTHPKSVVHPTIFMFAASEGSSGGGQAPAPGPPPAPMDACRDNQIEKNKRNPPDVKYQQNDNQYVTEVHATWRYAQMDDGWASELHFATMIIEDETPIQYYTSRLTHSDGVSYSWKSTYTRRWNQTSYRCYGAKTECCWRYKWAPSQYRGGRIQLGLINSCVNETYNTNRPYGFSARYTAIKPTFNTRGGWDYFRKEYISPKDVDCHVDIKYDPDGYYTLKDEPVGKFSRLPTRKTLKDFLKDKYTLENPAKYQPPVVDGRSQWFKTDNYENTYELPDWHSIGMTMNTVKNFPTPSKPVKTHWYLGKKPEDAIKKMFDSVHQDPIVLKNELEDKPFREYFGTRYVVPDKEPVHPDVVKLLKTEDGGRGPQV